MRWLRSGSHLRERLCPAQLDGPGPATVKGRGAEDTVDTLAWLPEACFTHGGLLDLSSAEGMALGG